MIIKFLGLHLIFEKTLTQEKLYCYLSGTLSKFFLDHYFLWKADFWLSDLKRKYAAAPNQIERDTKRIRYVENPSSAVAKAKVIEFEVEVNTFLSEIFKEVAFFK